MLIESKSSGHEPGLPAPETAAVNFSRSETPRATIRAAVTSNRTSKAVSGNGSNASLTTPPVELELAAEVQNLIAKAQLLARQRQLDAARSLISQALQLEPANAEAWTWLGGLLIDQNLERARLCLKRGLDLDPTNVRARRGLDYVDEKLSNRDGPVHPDRQMVLAQPLDSARPVIKIGLEEIVENLRQSGMEPEPDNIPLGGARYRPAIEKGELVMPSLRPQWNKNGREQAALRGKRRPSRFLILLVAVLILSGVAGGTWWVNSYSQAGPVETGSLLTAPAPAVSPDESFALRLRYAISAYNSYYATARNLRQQVQHGHISWEEYRRNTKNLQTEIKNQKNEVDTLAQVATPHLLNLYRELQNIASLTNLAADNNLGGIENTNPEDLEESNRQYLEATRRLADLARNLNTVAPV